MINGNKVCFTSEVHSIHLTKTEEYDKNIKLNKSVVLSREEHPNYHFIYESDLFIETLFFRGKELKSKDTVPKADEISSLNMLNFPEGKGGLVRYKVIDKIPSKFIYQAVSLARKIKKESGFYPILFIYRDMEVRYENEYTLVLPRQRPNENGYGEICDEHLLQLCSFNNMVPVAIINFMWDEPEDHILTNSYIGLDNVVSLVLNATKGKIHDICTGVTLPGLETIVREVYNFVDYKNYNISHVSVPKRLLRNAKNILIEPTYKSIIKFPEEETKRKNVIKLAEDMAFLDFLKYEFRIDLDNLQEKEVDMFLEEKENGLEEKYRLFKKEFSFQISTGSPPQPHFSSHERHDKSKYLTQPDNYDKLVDNIKHDEYDAMLEKRVKAVRKDLSKQSIESAVTTGRVTTGTTGYGSCHGYH